MSSPRSMPIGVAAYEYFQYAVPSLLNADFTISVFKDGASVSNAGITITYVSDREYTVTFNATTSFVATAGYYDIVVSRTALPDDRWEFSALVSQSYYNTLGNYTAPIAIFISISGDGRVTDGVNPLAGALVTITRPNGSVLAQAVTDVNGLWGTISFDVNGNHTVTVQKSSYLISQATIVVAAPTATGPGTDITLTAVTSSSGILASSLWGYARRMYKDHTGTKADTEIAEAVNEALWMVSSYRDDPWYQTVAQITIEAAYTTGTVTVTQNSPIVTLAAGTWPTWAADGDIMLNGLWYPVLTRDSGTQITLGTDWVGDTTSSYGYTLAQWQYDLPDDLRRMDLVIESNVWPWGPEPVSRATLELARSSYVSVTGTFGAWAIERNRIMLWPYPQETQTVNLLYYRQPAALISSGDSADWDFNRLEILRRAIDFQIAARGDCVAGTREECMKRFTEAFNRSNVQDRTSSTRRLGVAGGGFYGLRYGAQILP